VTIDRLTDLDRLMLGASKTWPQDIGAIAFLDGTLVDSSGRLRIDEVRRAIESRLHLVPRFRQLIHYPRSWMGGPLWVDDPHFDLSQHVMERLVRPPGGEAELLDTVEQLRRRRLDPSRPLWEMWLLPGLADQRVGLYVRIHHAIADGLAAMATVVAFLDAEPDTPVTSPRPWRPAPPPSNRDLLIDNLVRRSRSLAKMMASLLRPWVTARRLGQALPAMRELITEEASARTSLDRMVGPARNIALIKTDLETVRSVAHAHGATVNDVLLTVTGGGLRTLLQSRGEPVDDTTLRVYVPISLRRPWAGPQQGNVIAQMAVPLHLGEPDPERRLRTINSETVLRKARARSPLDGLIHGRMARRLLLMAVVRQRVNVTTANIPGPPMPLYLAGARIIEVFPALPLIANEPLGVGALSYAGDLNIGIAADRDAIPDLEVLVAGISDQLQALGIRPTSRPQAQPEPRMSLA
jgi:WS/DGAT/MGAT family acyltransferase